MGRSARFIPENRGGVLVEVTCRCIGARALLVPAPDPRRFNEVVVGVMGRALEVSRGTASSHRGRIDIPPLELCSATVVANHFHWLLVVYNQQQLSRFMQQCCGNLSKEIGGRKRNWRGAFWERRYDGIVVSDEPAAQWARLKYVLSHGVKEGLVESPMDWPGVHTARELVHGEPLEGYWWSRSKEWAARNRNQEYQTYDFATRYRIELSPLPAFRHLTHEAYQNKIAGLIREIEQEGEQKRDGDPVAGIEKVLSQNPYEPPTRTTKRSTKPLFHVASREARDDLRRDLAGYLAQYRIASEALLSGNLNAASWFPEGSYPPALPFVGPPSPQRPPSPPTRPIVIHESGNIDRGEIPIIEIAATVEVRVRGQPP